jgi:hypothetical protein
MALDELGSPFVKGVGVIALEEVVVNLIPILPIIVIFNVRPVIGRNHVLNVLIAFVAHV